MEVAKEGRDACHIPPVGESLVGRKLFAPDKEPETILIAIETGQRGLGRSLPNMTILLNFWPALALLKVDDSMRYQVHTGVGHRELSRH